MLKVQSAAFSEGNAIPKQYTCDGRDVSPPLSWSGVPAQARSLALICDDPDAPRKTWVHWVLFDLPAGTAELPEAVPPGETTPAGGTQGTNDFRKLGYGGPCPPSGTHRYEYKLAALDAKVGLRGGSTKKELLAAMEGHVLAEAKLTGKYSRR